jgi:hypothetical protein
MQVILEAYTQKDTLGELNYAGKIGVQPGCVKTVSGSEPENGFVYLEMMNDIKPPKVTPGMFYYASNPLLIVRGTVEEICEKLNRAELNKGNTNA